MTYKYMLFDMDGTLCDPGPGITDSVQYALSKLGVAEHDEMTLRRFVGPPLADMFKSSYGFDEAKTAKAIALYREEFQAVGLAKYRAYAGMAVMLENLRADGKIMAVATSKADHFTHQILTNTKLIDYFQVISAPKLQELHLTKGDIIRAALKELGDPSKSEVVMIGDRAQDIIGAQENGIDSIGILYGYGDRPELERAGPSYIEESVVDLARRLS